MNAFKTGYKEFIEIAHQKGYTKKVVGDYCYRKPRKRNGKVQYIKLLHIDRFGNMGFTEGEQ